MGYIKYFGEIIRIRGLSQRQLGKSLGIHPARISALMYGKRKPTLEEKQKFEKFFDDTPAGVLFDDTEDDDEITEEPNISRTA